MLHVHKINSSIYIKQCITQHILFPSYLSSLNLIRFQLSKSKMTSMQQICILMALTLITIMLANVHESEAFSLFGKTVHVKITNRLSQKKRLLVHCKSKNDDLGEHWLRTGESYEFKFGESFMWTSLFFCGYTFDGQKHLEDAYDATQNDCREHCWWEIKEPGPCLYKDGQYTQCHKWHHIEPVGNRTRAE